jgi:uncharacterized SAM-binding protein YcdF (DUF218 family)
MRAIVTMLVSPLGAALALWLLALLLESARAWRSSRAVALLGFSWLLMWSMPTPSLALRERLEKDYPPVEAAALPAAPAIVLLAGGADPPVPPRADPNLFSSADRMWFAARLYRAGRAPLVVLSGGADPARSPTSEAEAMQRLLRDFGVPDSAMLLETASRTTGENAQFTAQLLGERRIGRVLLVTSALHMERAKREFEAAGIEVIPAPTDHEGVAPPAGLRGWLPDSGALDGSSRAFKELVGRQAVGR